MSMCSRCGTEAAPTDRFCKRCGQRFDVNDSDFALAERAPLYVPASGMSWPASASSPSTAVGGAAPVPPAGDLQPAASPASGGLTSGVAVTTATIPAVARLLVRPVSSVDPAESREYALDGHDIAIGRSPSCDIRLEGDQLISRRHALLRYDGERYTVVDLGSSNGTYVNDVEITEAHPLADGDRILLGEHELAYTTGPASASAIAVGAPAVERVTARVPAPKTEPHAMALPPTDVAPRPATSDGLPEPELSEPTIPKSESGDGRGRRRADGSAGQPTHTRIIGGSYAGSTGGPDTHAASGTSGRTTGSVHRRAGRAGDGRRGRRPRRRPSRGRASACDRRGFGPALG